MKLKEIQPSFHKCHSCSVFFAYRLETDKGTFLEAFWLADCCSLNEASLSPLSLPCCVSPQLQSLSFSSLASLLFLFSALVAASTFPLRTLGLFTHLIQHSNTFFFPLFLSPSNLDLFPVWSVCVGAGRVLARSEPRHEPQNVSCASALALLRFTLWKLRYSQTGNDFAIASRSVKFIGFSTPLKPPIESRVRTCVSIRGKEGCSRETEAWKSARTQLRHRRASRVSGTFRYVTLSCHRAQKHEAFCALYACWLWLEVRAAFWALFDNMSQLIESWKLSIL